MPERERSCFIHIEGVTGDDQDPRNEFSSIEKGGGGVGWGGGGGGGGEMRLKKKKQRQGERGKRGG